MQGTMKGRHVVVTGATGELGGAVVRRLVRAGATCHLPCRTGARADALARELGNGVQVTQRIDLADAASVAAWFESLPPIDGSVHCVGGFAVGALDATSPAALEWMMDLNLLPTMLCTCAAIHAMRRHGRPGRIVNVAALVGLEPELAPHAVAYACAKSAVIGLTRSVAPDAARHGILLNAVAPDAMDTPANRASMSDAAASRLVPLDSVAATIEWLLSADVRSMSGVVVPCVTPREVAA